MQETTSAETGLFVRRATGLVKEIGLRDAFTLNLMTASIGTGFIVMLVALAVFPQTELTLAFILAAIPLLLLALSYTQLVAAMPRSGGDYVFVSRILHPALGAAIGGMLLLVFAYINGLNAVVWSQTFFPFFFTALGDGLGTSFDSVAADVAGKTPSFLVSVATFVILGVIASLGLRRLTRFIFWCFVIGMVGFVVVLGEYLFHGNAAFISEFNAAANVPNAYDQVITSADDAGIATGVELSAILSAVPFAALLLFGVTFSVYPGGEVKQPMRTTKYGTLFGLGFAVLCYLLAWLLLRKMAGLDFLQASSGLSSADPDEYGRITDVSPIGNSLALLVADDPVTKLIMAVAFPAWSIGLLMTYFLVLSRVVFAQSFDRLLPQRLAAVSDRTHAPVAAIALATVGFIGFAALSIYTSVLAELFRNVTLLFEVVFTTVSIAAMLLPYRKPELYQASPKLFRGSWFGLPPITVIGGASALANGLLLYLIASNTDLVGEYDLASVATLVAIPLVGILLYVIARLYWRSRGLDLKLAMRELPPD